MAPTGRKIVSRNKKAFHDYHILDTYEAGLVLQGSEIKSIRANRISLQDGWVQANNGELWLMGVHISPYEQAGIFGHKDPLRPRKLLLHKKEIARIINEIQQKGFTAVPTMVYLDKGRAKVEIGIAKGKKLYDKRESIAKRDSEREIRRSLKGEYQ
jgi:SsrA-binding protein